MNDFVTEHTSLVRGIAHSLRRELGLITDLDDLVAYGFEGLLEARERFDPDRGIPFTAFAHYRVRGAILDGVRRMADLPRRAHYRRRRAAAMDAIAEALAVSPAPPDEDDDGLGALMGAIDDLGDAFMLASVADDMRPPVPTPEQLLTSELDCARLRRALDKLPERERVVVNALYFDEGVLDDAGRVLGISRSVASRIHTNALWLLRKELG